MREGGVLDVPGPPRALVAALLGAAVASRFVAIAAFPGENDEAVFAGAVTNFDLFDLSPQAPGFPLWILLGRALVPLVPSPFGALCVASTLLAAAALPALYLWGRRLVGEWAALGGTVIASFLPIVWYFGGRAFTDTPATALFLSSLAVLPPEPESRLGVLRAALAGLLAAAAAGVRPHLVIAFGPLLLLWVVRAWRSGAGRRAAFWLVAAGMAGCVAWGAFLLGEAGGMAGLLASVQERASFRSHALATGTFRSRVLETFLVKDFLSWKRALAALALLAVGLAATWRRGRRPVAELLLVLGPLFVSLWFLHSREMARYSVPFALVVSLPVAAGLAALLRNRWAGLAGALAVAAVYGAEAWPEVRASATLETPPAAAIDHIARTGHPGRETLVADAIFHPFLRTERWEGRLGIWGLTDSELLLPVPSLNRRLVRLADFTDETEPPDRLDPAWRTWFRGGRVAEALGNRRLLAVSLRDPAPPLFGPGFGVKETVRGKPSFRWAGRTARLIVPGLSGPPIAVLTCDRPPDAGPDTVRVTDTSTGRLLVERTIVPGGFELVIAPVPVYGPLDRPREVVISCQRPKALPKLAGATRPREGCFTVREATFSFPPGSAWEAVGAERSLDVGARSDAAAVPDGFFGRETVEPLGLDLRWTTARAEVTWFPVAGLFPVSLGLRCRAPSAAPVPVTVSIGGREAGRLAAEPGGFRVQTLALSDWARAALSGPVPAVIELRVPTYSPRRAGQGTDERELGIAVDRIVVR